MGFMTYAAEKYTENNRKSESGNPLVAIRNNTNNHAHCIFVNDRGHIIAEFWLKPKGVSRWYNEPQGSWTWECK